MQVLPYHLIIGSNLGSRPDQLAMARQQLQTRIGDILRQSQIYETQPWGFEDQPWFLNQAILIETPLEPIAMLHQLKLIEAACGRQPGEKWHARHLDIDILLRGDLIWNQDGLIIPHPLLHTRNFVLVPLLDIAAESIHPVFGKTIEELYEECRDTGEVYIFSPDEQDNPV